MINNEEEYTKMASAEKELWWYQVLHEKTLKALKNNNCKPGDLVIDVGCGTGGLMLKLVESGYHAVGVDISEHAVSFCKKKNLEVHTSNLSLINTLFSEKQAKAVVSNDSFYYFADEEPAILEKLKKILKDDGLLIINYPALAAFGGIHDISVGIKSRITRKKLNGILEKAGFEVLESGYWPFLLSPLIFLVRLFQRIKLKTSKNVVIRSDVSMPGNLTNRLLYGITKSESILGLNLWGSSLFVVAKKKTIVYAYG